MSEWDKLKKRRSEFISNINSKEQDYIDYLLTEGDKLQENIYFYQNLWHDTRKRIDKINEYCKYMDKRFYPPWSWSNDIKKILNGVEILSDV